MALNVDHHTGQKFYLHFSLSRLLYVRSSFFSVYAFFAIELINEIPDWHIIIILIIVDIATSCMWEWNFSFIEYFHRTHMFVQSNDQNAAAHIYAYMVHFHEKIIIIENYSYIAYYLLILCNMNIRKKKNENKTCNDNAHFPMIKRFYFDVWSI